MKTLKLFHVIFISLLLSSISLYSFSSHEGDTLIAGDTGIVRCVSVGYDPDHLTAELRLMDSQYPYYCPECPDTIWSYVAKLINDTTIDFYFDIPLGTMPGEYYMVLHEDDTELPSIWWYGRIYSPPYIVRQPNDAIACEGDTVFFEVRVLGDDLSHQWYHNDIKISDFYDGIIWISDALPQDTGIYYCILANYFGTDTSHTGRLSFHPSPTNPGPPVGPDIFCPGTGYSWYSIGSDPLAIGYTWHFSPEEAGYIEFGDTSARVTWDPDFSGTAKIYVTVSGGECGDISSGVMEVTVPGLSAPPEICIIGIDEETGKYRVVWEKSAIDSEKLYRIYRESNQADIYLEVGAVYPDTISLFVDPSSAPGILSHRYKLSYIDSCGNESELSAYHQTMHLSANLGIDNSVNLIWSKYEGILFPTYDIYRGKHKDSLSLWNQVPSTVNSITDDEPPEGKIYYQIGMSNPAGCNPAKKSSPDYSYSRSNIEQVYVSGINEISDNKFFTVYPNPAGKEIQVRLKKPLTSPNHYAIFNSLGSLVCEGMIRPGYTDIDVSSLSPGFYILQLSDGMEINTGRFVIEGGNY